MFWLALLRTNNEQVADFYAEFVKCIILVTIFKNLNLLNLKLRDLAKLCFFLTDYDEIEVKKSFMRAFK